MSPVKAITNLFFVVSLALAGLTLKNAYDAYAEQTNTEIGQRPEASCFSSKPTRRSRTGRRLTGMIALILGNIREVFLRC